MVIDIYSNGEYPSNVLSNFYPNEFEIDGVKCASMEGFLQSLKTGNASLQIKICTLSGKTAKNYFKHKWNNFIWKLTGNLYWQGRKIKRRGEEYQQLLDRAYEALSQNEVFIKALADTDNAVLIHSIGKNNPKTTVLTTAEFTQRLVKIRDGLKN